MSAWRSWLEKLTTWDLIFEAVALLALLVGGLFLYLRSP